MDSFKSFCNESWLSRKKNNDQLTGIKSPDEKARIQSDTQAMIGTMSPDSLYNALRNYSTPDGRKYSQEQIEHYGNDQERQKAWEKYKGWYASSQDIRNKQLVAARAFELMGIPEPRPPMAIPYTPPAAIPIPEPPDRKRLIQVVRNLANENPQMGVPEIKEKLLKDYPGLFNRYRKMTQAQLGRLIKSALKPSLVKPPEEDDAEQQPQENPDILSFSRYAQNRKRGSSRLI